MGRNKLTKTLDIYLNSFLVGLLEKETSGAITFQYDADWIPTNFAISNSLPIKEGVYRGEEVSRYFDNLLPDNEEIKQKVAVKFGAESIRPFDMLEVIGRDCVGALAFIPEGINPPVTDAGLQYKEVTDAQIANKLRELNGASPLGMEEGNFRLSIAGAQEKTALLKVNGKWCDPIGATATTHILKKSIGAFGLEIDFADSIDNEWASLLIMKKMGLDCCEATIENFEDQRIISVKRFDRKWDTANPKSTIHRIPQEDFCQALGISPYKKYQKDGGPGILDINNFLKASKKTQDRTNFLKAIMVFDLLHAIDGHGKNFSLFLETDGFKLTPFYDVMSGYFLIKNKKIHHSKLKLAMKVGNSGHYSFDKIVKRHYEETALKCGFSKDEFEVLLNDLKERYENLHFEDSELDPHLNRQTLDIILEGMKVRSSRLFG